MAFWTNTEEFSEEQCLEPAMHSKRQGHVNILNNQKISVTSVLQSHLDSLHTAYIGVPCLTTALLASAVEKCAALGFFHSLHCSLS